MTTPLISALAERHGLPTIDETTIDAFLAPAEGEAAHALLFFTGDPAQRAETSDVAVVLQKRLHMAEIVVRARRLRVRRFDLGQLVRRQGHRDQVHAPF